MSLRWLEEPQLSFGNGYTHTNPKIGIPLFGPRSLNTPRHKTQIHVGFIGESESIEKVNLFLSECSKGILAVDVKNGSQSFPGISTDQGFGFEIVISDSLIQKITSSEKEKINKIRSLYSRFTATLDILEEKVSILCEQDHPLDYIFIVLSEDVYKDIRVVNTPDPISNKGHVIRNFRRVLKARLMKYNKPTQIIRDSTVDHSNDDRDMEDFATRAWNIFTSMYYKVGGLPWGPINLLPATCYVGINFYHPFGESNDIRASVAQAFNEYGDGLILRGQKFKWNDEIGKSPHLSQILADQLVNEVVSRYQLECKQKPRRVVIYKSSRFEQDELEGFKNALAAVSEYDLVTVGTSGNFRLFRFGEYPPLRGTIMNIGSNYFLYTTGYISELKKYPHGHVPSPLRIIDHFGDTSKNKLLEELFILTKMNWNTANVDGAVPITLQFARLVGEILKEFPESETPNPKYIFYM